ncbi:hypothetical protein AOLI_G00134840 [Acnodon oligacanthus]
MCSSSSQHPMRRLLKGERHRWREWKREPLTQPCPINLLEDLLTPEVVNPPALQSTRKKIFKERTNLKR